MMLGAFSHTSQPNIRSLWGEFKYEPCTFCENIVQLQMKDKAGWDGLSKYEGPIDNIETSDLYVKLNK